LSLGMRRWNRSRRFADSRLLKNVAPVTISTGPIKACNKPVPDRITAKAKHNRNRSRCVLRWDRRNGGVRGDYGDAVTNQIGGEFWQSIVLSICPAVFDL